MAVATDLSGNAIAIEKINGATLLNVRAPLLEDLVSKLISAADALTAILGSK